MTRKIHINSASDIAAMRVAGKLAAEVLDYITPHVVAGVTTETLDKLCHDYIVHEQKAYPAPLGYLPAGSAANKKPYPKSICTSVNYQVCHGIPSDRVLKEGDIVNIDVTVIKEGFHGDTSRMFCVGEVSPSAQRLCTITKEAMMLGIAAIKPGGYFGDIGYAIQQFVEGAYYSVVREYCGHGINRVFHDAPEVLHYGKRSTGAMLQAGMIFTVEPMVNAGRPDTRLLGDGWTVITRDRSLSAQWEHTVLVTENGYEILTLSH